MAALLRKEKPGKMAVQHFDHPYREQGANRPSATKHEGTYAATMAVPRFTKCNWQMETCEAGPGPQIQINPGHHSGIGSPWSWAFSQKALAHRLRSHSCTTTS